MAALKEFTLPHFEAWASRLILDTGESWELEEFQRQFLEDLFTGAPEAWFIIPEGNGKTTLIAGLALYGLRFAPDALIPVAASSRDQARIMYRQAKGFLRRSDLDDGEIVFEAFDGYRRIDLRGPGKTKRGEVLGTIEIHAADAGTGDGVIPYPFAFIDELHRHKSLDLYETWRGKLNKRTAQLVTISTAGEPGGDFETTREAIRQSVAPKIAVPGFTRCVTEEVVLHEHALEDGAETDDFAAVKRCNPLSSITVETLSKKHATPTMTPAHWARFTCNVPTRSENAAVGELEWHSALVETDRWPLGERVWLGLDVGWKWDTTALVPLWVDGPEFRLFGPCEVLLPPRDGTSLHPSLVEAALIRSYERNPFHTVVMDTSRAEQLAEWISSEFDVVVIDRQQTNTAAVEDYERFMEALRQGWLHHIGDRELSRHTLNAVARVLPRGDARFDRPHQSRLGSQQDQRVIDALVAGAMAHSLAHAEMTGGGGLIY